MQKRLISYALLAASAASAAIVEEVREAIEQNNLHLGESRIQAYRAKNGVTSEMLEAMSWLGRGALAAKQFDQAEGYARQVHQLALSELKKRPLDQEPRLPLALGAAIEVQSQVLAARGERDAAVEYLKSELKTYYATSIRTRLQKNLNLLSLEGKPAPAIANNEWVGTKPPALAALKGKPVVLFFWAHWCGDCKTEVAMLARLQQEYKGRFTLMGPTQRYGYVAQGEDAPPEVELRYIDAVRQKYYGRLADMTTPLSEEAFKSYGCSTTPTIVVIDRAGIVRLYHPGKMTYDELHKVMGRLLAS